MVSRTFLDSNCSIFDCVARRRNCVRKSFDLLSSIICSCSLIFDSEFIDRNDIKYWPLAMRILKFSEIVFVLKMLVVIFSRRIRCHVEGSTYTIFKFVSTHIFLFPWMNRQQSIESLFRTNCDDKSFHTIRKISYHFPFSLFHNRTRQSCCSVSFTRVSCRPRL